MFNNLKEYFKSKSGLSSLRLISYQTSWVNHIMYVVALILDIIFNQGKNIVAIGVIIMGVYGIVFGMKNLGKHIETKNENNNSTEQQNNQG